jgi:hypothetical protein
MEARFMIPTVLSFLSSHALALSLAAIAILILAVMLTGGSSSPVDRPRRSGEPEADAHLSIGMRGGYAPGPETIDLENEDGDVGTFTVIEEFDVGGSRYATLFLNEEDEDFLVMRRERDGRLAFIESDAEFDSVVAYIKSLG